MKKQRTHFLRWVRRRVRRIEPLLKQRIWAPMTYMLIPSLLKGADKLIDELQEYCSQHRSPKARELLDRILSLRKGFKREG